MAQFFKLASVFLTVDVGRHPRFPFEKIDEMVGIFKAHGGADLMDRNICRPQQILCGV